MISTFGEEGGNRVDERKKAREEKRVFPITFWGEITPLFAHFGLTNPDLCIIRRLPET
jgi:hypothetical protein